jgi:hypothetical protein
MNLKMLRQAQHENLSGLHPELVEGFMPQKAMLRKSYIFYSV